MPEGHRTMGLAGEIPADTFRQRIFSLGPVDIIVTHIPPMIPELTYDVVRKTTGAGQRRPVWTTLTPYHPAYAFFGHVHNPSRQSMRIGRTHAVNLGFFKKNGTVTRARSIHRAAHRRTVMKILFLGVIVGKTGQIGSRPLPFRFHSPKREA